VKSKTSVLPPLIDGCDRNFSTSNVTYPINLMVLSQLVNETALAKYDGTITFVRRPRINVPDIQTVKLNDRNLVEIQKQGADFKKIMPLAKEGLTAFLDGGSFVDKVDSLSEQILQLPGFGEATLVTNIVGFLLAVAAVVACRKRKIATSAATATVLAPLMETTEAAKVWPHQHLHDHNHDSHTDKQLIQTDDSGCGYWCHIQPMVYLILTYWAIKFIIWTLKQIYKYFTTRLLVTPFNTIPAIQNKANIFLHITNNRESLLLYIYQLETHASDLMVSQCTYRPGIKVIDISGYPSWNLHYKININNNLSKLVSKDGRVFKLPDSVQLPLHLLPKFRRITKDPYFTRLHAGIGGCYYEVPEVENLPPTFVLGEDTNCSGLETIDDDQLSALY
jgi:hypothetical protein